MAGPLSRPARGRDKLADVVDEQISVHGGLPGWMMGIMNGAAQGQPPDAERWTST